MFLFSRNFILPNFVYFVLFTASAGAHKYMSKMHLKTLLGFLNGHTHIYLDVLNS